MKLKLILLLFILITCKSEESREPRVKKEYPRDYGGKVRQIVEYKCDKYFMTSGLVEIRKNSCSIYNVAVFSAEEVLIEEKTWYDLDYPNEPGFFNKVKLNAQGRIVESYVKQLGAFGEPDKVTLSNFSYNQDGFRTEETIWSNGQLTYREDIEFDAYNCPVKETYYDENNQIKYYNINRFDSKNREISTEKFDKNDVLEKKWIKTYLDNSKDWNTKTVYDSNGVVAEKESKEANRNDGIKVNFLYTDNLPSENYKDVEYYPNSKKIRTWHFINQNGKDIYQTYDQTGRLIERKIQFNGEWQDTKTIMYHEDGAILEESESTSRVVGKNFYKKTTSFKVDFNGNWTEKYTIDNEGNMLSMKIREFEYY